MRHLKLGPGLGLLWCHFLSVLYYIRWDTKYDVISCLGSLPISSQDDSVLDTQEKRVAAWKFSVLDTDKDGRLKSRETRSLQKMVKKYVKPKSCARKFIKNCDSIEKDKYVSREEWFRCLGLDDKSKDSKYVNNNWFLNKFLEVIEFPVIIIVF